jgi:DnaJ domain
VSQRVSTRNRRNYYRILHVQPDAPEQVIRSSYRTLMQRMKMHPDLGGNHEDATLLNEAYATLTDPEARARYDAQAAVGPRGRGDDSARPARAAPQLADPDGCCAFCGLAHPGDAPIEPDQLCARCASALYPAERHRFGGDSKRGIDRFPRRAAVRFWSGWPGPAEHVGMTEDLSLDGLQLRSAVGLESGLVVKLATDDFDAVGFVVDCQALDEGSAYRWRMGLAFLTLRLARQRGMFVSVDV